MLRYNANPKFVQEGRSFGDGRGYLSTRAGRQTSGLGDSYGSSSGFSSWNDGFGTRSSDEEPRFRRGFRRSVSPEDERVSAVGFPRGFQGAGTEEDWETPEEDWETPEEDWETPEEDWETPEEDWETPEEDCEAPVVFNRGFRGSSKWIERDFGGVNQQADGKDRVRSSGGRDSVTGRVEWGRRNVARIPSNFGCQRGPVGGLSGVKKEPVVYSGYVLKKGNKQVPRDTNYETLKRYVHRIDRRVKSGRTKGIISTSCSRADAKLINDFIYFLAQADQNLRRRLAAAREASKTYYNVHQLNHSENQQLWESDAMANIYANMEADQW